MDYKYQEALYLYDRCDYEGAYNVLSNSNQDFGNKGYLLLEECKKQILQQYVYLINEAEKQKDIGEANRLKAMYIEKYGRNNLISDPQDDDEFFRRFFLYFAALLILFSVLMVLLYISYE